MLLFKKTFISLLTYCHGCVLSKNDDDDVYRHVRAPGTLTSDSRLLLGGRLTAAAHSWSPPEQVAGPQALHRAKQLNSTSSWVVPLCTGLYLYNNLPPA